MQLLDLPEEVMIIIIRKLDICSVLSLYNTCNRIRNIVCIQGVIKQCFMSRNVCATVNTLKLNFFKDISDSLLELNMCGVPDLSRTAVVKAMKKLKHLKVLDISFTNLDILDLIEIQKVCPTIINVTVNINSSRYGQSSKENKLHCQSVFEYYKNVHFVGPLFHLLRSKLLKFFVAKSKLLHLKYTVTDIGNSFDNNDSLFADDNETSLSRVPHFDQFTAFIMNWKDKTARHILNLTYASLSYYPILSLFKSDEYVYVVIILKEFDPKVYTSPVFHNFFKEKFNITVGCLNSDLKLYPNMAFMIWNKASINFNDTFFNTLEKVMKLYLPSYFTLGSEFSNLSISSENGWFYTIPSEVTCDTPVPITKIGNKRVAAPTLLLNYDATFKEIETIELSIIFKNPMNSPMALTADCEYLRKLTYLSLVNFRRHTSDFFNILFRSCINLKTLNVEGSGSPCTSTIARSLPLSRCLKNLRLVDRCMDFSSLFTSFTQCSTLENIHVVDYSEVRNDLSDPSVVVDKCRYLYSVYIEAEMSDATQKRISNLFNIAKKRYMKHCINVAIIKKSEALRSSLYGYDTYINVFKLNPVRPF